MPRLFGTDGVRGVAGADLTPELALALASAAVHELVEHGEPGQRPRVVVGRDPRPSGDFLEGAVVAGLLAAGADVEMLGIIPTPAVAHAVATGDKDLGVMITASHNPMPDNGIKFFGRGGYKLPDDIEDRIEGRLAEPWQRPTGGGVGRRYDVQSLHRDAYVAYLLGTMPHDLAGLRVVVDCANGAASTVAPTAYREAGADLVVINDDTSGDRINDECGATDLAALQAAVTEFQADVGIAHDGDADRCLAVDAEGGVVDGDPILAILSLGLHAAGQLSEGTVVTTVMANLGFRQAMAEHGITVVETPVGDRYVLERMRRDGFVIGGEQSGHLILAQHASTGDGVLTGLHLLARVAATGLPLRDLARVMTRLPQVLVGVRVGDREAAMQSAVLGAAVSAAEAELGSSGRILVRPSGTEPVIRVMVEAPQEDTARTIAERVASAIS